MRHPVTTEQVMEAVMERSQNCRRAVIGEGHNAYGHVIAIAAMAGPDSIEVVQLVAPDFPFNFNLN